MRFIVLLATVAIMGVAAVHGQEQFDIVGSLVLPANAPDTIILASNITVATPLDFKRALQRRPGAKTIELASDGGSVYGALVMAVEIHERGLNTHIPEGFGCYSACAYLYFAGARREMEGALGVHQISAGDMDIGAEAAQLTVADIIDTISSFGVAPGVISVMLRTPPDDMYIFSEAEVAALSLERMATIVAVAATPSLPEPHSSNVSTVVIDSTALTVLPKTTPADRVALGRAERILTIHEGVTLREVLSKNGFTAAMIEAVDAKLSSVFPGIELPVGARMRILFGPSRSATVLVPYRLSLYTSGSVRGVFDHRVTVALTDDGQYVLGLEPTAVQLGEVTLGRLHPPNRPALEAETGKTSRFPWGVD